MWPRPRPDMKWKRKRKERKGDEKIDHNGSGQVEIIYEGAFTLLCACISTKFTFKIS